MKRIIAVLGLALLLAPCAHAQLPTVIKPDNIVEVFRVVGNGAKAKGEFESEAQYKARIDATLRGLQTKELYFLLGSSWGKQISTKYDIDSGKIEVVIPRLSRSICDQYSKHDHFVISEKNLQRSSYVATNALGAKTTVLKANSEEYNLVIVNDNDMVYINKIDANPQVAQNIKRGFALVIACNVAEKRGEFFCEYIEQITPTLRNPVDFTILHKALFVNVKEMLLVDPQKHAVLLRIPVGP